MIYIICCWNIIRQTGRVQVPLLFLKLRSWEIYFFGLNLLNIGFFLSHSWYQDIFPKIQSKPPILREFKSSSSLIAVTCFCFSGIVIERLLYCFCQRKKNRESEKRKKGSFLILSSVAKNAVSFSEDYFCDKQVGSSSNLGD